jgi:signal transduction histidine kinase
VITLLKCREFTRTITMITSTGPGLTGRCRIGSKARYHELMQTENGIEIDGSPGGSKRGKRARVHSLEVINRALQRQLDQHKHAEEQLRHARDQLTQANQELERRVDERTARLRETIGDLEAFSYSVSHDMRAPLRAMQGYAQLLQEQYGGSLDAEAAEYLQRIRVASVRLDRLIQDLLSYSRIIRAEMKLAPVDLDKLVHDILANYPGWQPPEAHITVENSLGVACGNDAFLTQCVTNLVGNAVKFVAPGTIPRVRIWGEDKEEWIRINFTDNGIGIDPSQQQRIFGMFERIHHPNEYDGTGIGLSIVRKAVERMGGELGVESQAGQGSTFWIDLKKAK